MCNCITNSGTDDLSIWVPAIISIGFGAIRGSTISEVALYMPVIFLSDLEAAFRLTKLRAVL